MNLVHVTLALVQVLAVPLVGAAAVPEMHVEHELAVTERDAVNSTALGLERRAPCAIHLGTHLGYDSWWRTGAFDRHRVSFNAEGGGPREGWEIPQSMRERYCSIAYSKTPLAVISLGW